MRFTSYLDCGKLTIELTGEIDHHCAKDYIASIMAKLEAYTPSVCILNFQDVTFMDSSGIAVVINTLRTMNKMKGTLILSGLREQPLKVIRAAGVDKLIEIKELVK